MPVKPAIPLHCGFDENEDSKIPWSWAEVGDQRTHNVMCYKFSTLSSKISEKISECEHCYDLLKAISRITLDWQDSYKYNYMANGELC